MGEYASKGVAGAGLGTGIAGLSLGVFNAMGNGLGIGSSLLGRTLGTSTVNTATELSYSEALAARDAEIARLNAKVYSDESDLAVYKYFESKLTTINERINAMELSQAQTNSAVNASLNVLNSQVQAANETLANITRTAIPTSAICNFDGTCNCSNT